VTGDGEVCLAKVKGDSGTSSEYMPRTQEEKQQRSIMVPFGSTATTRPTKEEKKKGSFLPPKWPSGFGFAGSRNTIPETHSGVGNRDALFFFFFHESLLLPTAPDPPKHVSRFCFMIYPFICYYIYITVITEPHNVYFLNKKIQLFEESNKFYFH